MKNKTRNKKKKLPEKYNLGSFVINNQQAINQATQAAGALAPVAGGGAGSGALSGLATGASVGSAILPGIGTAIGAGLGAIGGAIFGGSKKRKQEAAQRAEERKQEELRRAPVVDEYLSNIDTNNENPYGVYQLGGEVLPNIDPTINIEKGELQIDPTSGKILRKFTGINPESGGLYKPHNKGRDPKDNMVTAEEGSFIITKKEAKKYEDAVENNDKLYQNTIMSNIRNKKREEGKNKPINKYQTGGIVDPNLLANMTQAGVNPNLTPTIPTSLGAPNSFQGPGISNLTAASNTGGANLGSIADNLVNYLPSAVNLIQGSQSPNYLNYRPTRMNVGLRQRTLNNLPQEQSVNPVLNRLSSTSRAADRQILDSTSNPAISRALRASNQASLQRGISDVYNQSNRENNQIRSQRAGILSNLAGQDQQRSAQNAQMALGVDTQNRQMREGRRGQFNRGISQLQQMYQNNRRNRQLSDMDQRTLKLYEQIFPNAGGVFDSWRGGNR